MTKNGNEELSVAVELKPRFQKIHSRINRNKQLAEIIHFF